ncbi:MAG: hypothetical protein AAF433_00005 [Bacteroidota bacterium]
MINFFLRAKHWQVFLLILSLPILAQFLFFGLFFNDLNNLSDPAGAARAFDSYLRFIPWLILLSMGGLLAWFWSIGQGLQAQIPEDLRPKTSFFAISIAFPLLYFFLFFQVLMPDLFLMSPDSFPLENFRWLGLIIPLHFFAMFCMFYNMYFAARSIKLAELQRPVQAGDYLGDFFLFWFFVIGIWFIQPRVNQLAEEGPTNWQSDILDD